MRLVRKNEEDTYFREAAAWEDDMVARSKASEKRAWFVAGAATLIAVALAVALASLFPLRKTEWAIVRVDPVTGITDVQRVLKGGTEPPSEATDRYWLRLYVRDREGYVYDDYRYYYRVVGLLSSAGLAKAWVAYYRPRNDQAPINRYGDETVVRIRVRGVAFIGHHVAQVRYTRIEDPRGGKTKTTYWIATVSYRYVNPPMTDDQRAINPLGFQVTRYRTDRESGVVE